MEDLFKLLPDIIIYLIGGYLFITIYRFVSYKDRINDVEHFLLSSLTVGFIIKNVLTKFNQNSDLVYIVICGITAYLLALLNSFLNTNDKIINVLQTLRINRTNTPNIWYDFLPPISKAIVLKLTDTDNEICYVGCCTNVEEGEHQPFIVLSRYRKQKITGEILIDCSNDTESCVILNTENFSSIERIIYE